MTQERREARERRVIVRLWDESRRRAVEDGTIPMIFVRTPRRMGGGRLIVVHENDLAGLVGGLDRCPV
jgi:hypothetical protein